MTFSSRTEAGQKLGRLLQHQQIAADLVLGLPRGGVVVAAEVAQILRLPLDVLIVRKIGHPWNREFAVGALAEDGTVVLDSLHPGIDMDALEAVIAEEKQRLEDYRAKYHRPSQPALKDQRVMIVDDGLATGATTEAAVRSARKQAAAQVIVAVPVASTSAVHRLRSVADQVIAVLVDPAFMAVGQYYRVFDQTTDEEVRQALNPEP